MMLILDFIVLILSVVIPTCIALSATCRFRKVILITIGIVLLLWTIPRLMINTLHFCEIISTKSAKIREITNSFICLLLLYPLIIMLPRAEMGRVRKALICALLILTILILTIPLIFLREHLGSFLTLILYYASVFSMLA